MRTARQAESRPEWLSRSTHRQTGRHGNVRIRTTTTNKLSAPADPTIKFSHTDGLSAPFPDPGAVESPLASGRDPLTPMRSTGSESCSRAFTPGPSRSISSSSRLGRRQTDHPGNGHRHDEAGRQEKAVVEPHHLAVEGRIKPVGRITMNETCSRMTTVLKYQHTHS